MTIDKYKFFTALENRLKTENISENFMALAQNSISPLIDFLNNDSLKINTGKTEEAFKKTFILSAVEAIKEGNESYRNSLSDTFDDVSFLKRFGFHMEKEGLAMVGFAMINQFLTSEERLAIPISSKSADKSSLSSEQENISASTPSKTPNVAGTDSAKLDQVSASSSIKM